MCDSGNMTPPDPVCRFCDDWCHGSCEGAREARGDVPPPELNPCPFCGDRLAHIWTPATSGYSVICGNGCGAEGPVMENEERAAEAWNRRVGTSQ